MGRGSGADAIQNAFEAVNSRNGNLEGTALGRLMPLSLTQDEEAAVRGLFDLTLQEPEAPGFEIDNDSPEGAKIQALSEALEEKGITEQTDQGWWKLTEAGLQLSGQLLADGTVWHY